MPAGVSDKRIAAGIVDRHVPAFERRQHAARQRAIGRDQGGPALAALRRAVVDRFAQRDCDGERFLFRMRGFDHRHARRATSCALRKVASRSGAFARDRSMPPAATLPTRTPRAHAAAGRASVDHVAARDADALQQRRKAILRMTDRLRSPSARIIRHDASSRSVSRPGSTIAPCGNAAIVSSSIAVEGIEPVEPAAITGPPLPAFSRLVSASISRSRRSAISMTPRSASISGQFCRAIFRKSSVSCQYLSSSSGTRLSSLSHDDLPRDHVVQQARKLLRQREGGRGIVRDQRRALVRRDRRRPGQDQLREQVLCDRRCRVAAGRSSACAARRAGRAFGEHDLVFVDVADRRRCAAGSRHPARAHRERRRARAGRRAASADRASRCASDSGSPVCGNPSTSRPSSSALISAGRNGTEAGIVKTCGGRTAAIRRS